MKLTRRESEIIGALAEGFTYLQIQGKLGVTQASLHTHISNIRGKTGLREPKNPAHCLQFVESHLPHLIPTHTQQIILQKLADGFTHSEISAQIGVATSTVANHASQACKRLKIADTGPDRLAAIRTYLGWGGFLNGDPML